MKKAPYLFALTVATIVLVGLYQAAGNEPIEGVETNEAAPAATQTEVTNTTASHIDIEGITDKELTASTRKGTAAADTPEEQWTQAEIEADYVKAYSKYPHLRKNAMYASKALLSDAEMAEWRKALENRELIEETLKGLSDHYNPDFELTGSIVNQERIKFIKYSAQLAGNPAASNLFDGIEAFVTNGDRDLTGFSDELKRDLAGDKIELIYIYEAFREGGRAKLDELAAKSPRFAKLLKYARENSHHLNRII